ncbi:MAG: sigma-54-dependent Fis family transcriptional regulator [Melioribacteraceae bacterium]|nr:sigma-54-dependent Fis family transcriptional regulator [Melioribacteraceae bacterium]MCF8412597.1 sigma-54-dependent Fis family transcriptional regulator [Melioribacteraceae bacterium]
MINSNLDLNDKRQKLNKLLGEFLSETSSDFMKISALVKDDPELKKGIENLYKKLLDYNKKISASSQSFIQAFEIFEKELNKLKIEKKRLEKLYSSGILFQSETDMRKLMQVSIETVTKELCADHGFIVLVDNNFQVDNIVGVNLDPENDPEHKEFSNTIIKNTLTSAKPLKIDNMQNASDYACHESVVSLGLTAAVSVPLKNNDEILGVVYIDRRNQTEAFKDSDLTFLISFANQIVKGMIVSLEISSLEQKIAHKDSEDYKNLRLNFRSDDIIGTGKKLFSVLKLASKVSKSDVSILLLGENGTGKDLLARAIHNNGPRSEKPFVSINCGAIPGDLLESELFGFESGAFTGANKSKPGKLEIANGGTVFLDEIGEMNINLQAKILRVLQNREFERLGSVETKQIDVRFIAATNRNIAEMLADKTFREDLYYRLKVIEIKIPPLRERREDISELINFFIEKHSDADQNFEITNNALNALIGYDWPGNIRELENTIQRAIILAKSNKIDVEDLPAEILGNDFQLQNFDYDLTLSEAENDFRRMYISKIIKQTDSKAEAAKVLGINRSHLHKLISQLNINN